MRNPPPSLPFARESTRVGIYPRNNNRGCVHQHSFMAPHYSKRRAKGHGIFCRSNEGPGKTASPSFPVASALFARDRRGSLDHRHHCLFRRRGSRCEALPSPFERHAASRSARSTASLRSSHGACQLVSPVYRYCQPFTYPLPSPSTGSGPCNVTFRCIELIDAARYLATGFINCIDAPPTARRSAAVAPSATGGRSG